MPASSVSVWPSNKVADSAATTGGAALLPDTLLPQPPGGMAPGAALAVLVHGALLLGLTAVVDWRIDQPVPVTAELWASVPQQAAPPPPPPAPPPAPAPTPAPAPPPPPPVAKAEPPLPDPQIAIEKAAKAEKAALAEKAAQIEKARLQAEREKQAKELAEQQKKLKAERAAEAERQRLAAEAKKREQAVREQAAEDARLAKQREENLARMREQIEASGAPTSTGTAAQDAAPSAAYAGRLVARIKPNIVLTADIAGNPAAVVEVRSAPNGSILARRIVKSSGSADWDDAVLRAIDRTASLPRDSDGRVPPTLTITFRPRD